MAHYQSPCSITWPQIGNHYARKPSEFNRKIRTEEERVARIGGLRAIVPIESRLARRTNDPIFNKSNHKLDTRDEKVTAHSKTDLHQRNVLHAPVECIHLGGFLATGQRIRCFLRE